MIKKQVRIFVLILSLFQLCCPAQNVFDNYYKTGYHNNRSNNIIAQPDSGVVFVNYIIDSATYRFDMGLIHLDKQGNEITKTSFNMFNESYHGFNQGLNNFIEATSCSYLLSGTYLVGNKQGFIISKINRNTLDTLKNTIYADNYSYGMNNLIKLNDNKYYLIGSKWIGNNNHPYIVELDSNITITNTINVATSPDFGQWNCVYNPVTKKILIAGGTASGQYLNTFIHIDTLGNILQIKYGSKYYQYRGIYGMFFCPFDTSYIAIGDRKSGMYTSNVPRYKLCISKYDSNLKLKWEKTYGDGMPANCLTDGIWQADGSIVVSGNYSQILTSPAGSANNNGIIMKVTKDGNFVWAREYDHEPPGSYALGELFYGITRTADKGYAACGIVVGPPSSKQKAWAVKTDSMGCLLPGCVSSVMQVDSFSYPADTSNNILVSLHKLGEIKTIRIYPNPVNDRLTIELPAISPGEKNDYRLSISNALGQEILHIGVTSSFLQEDVSFLENGFYFLKVYENENLVASKKFIKE